MLQQQSNPSAELRSKPAQTVTIFTDGACSFNPGPGGWAARLLYGDGRVVELGGFAPETTNNRMELQAAIEGLRAVPSEAHPTSLSRSLRTASTCARALPSGFTAGKGGAGTRPPKNPCSTKTCGAPWTNSIRPPSSGSTPKATLATQTTSAATRSPRRFRAGRRLI